MGYPLYESVDELLTPATLGAILGVLPKTVQRVPMPTQDSAYSGSALAAIDADGTRLLLKHISPDWDYFMRVSGDRQGREALIYTSGLLDHLPASMRHAYLACARDGVGWAILMRDVGGFLLPPEGRVELAAHQAILSACAAFHAAFWETDLGPEFCTPWHHYHVVSPAAARADVGAHGSLHAIIQDGWDRLLSLVDPDVGPTLLDLANDPAPLVARLAELPQTLVHGDMRSANMGIEAGRLLAIDWALAGQGVATLDAVWYIANLAAQGPTSREASLEFYRNALAAHLGAERFTTDWWQPMLDLSLLGGVLRYGWIAARAVARSDGQARENALADLAWWVTAARRGLERL